jgi:RNA recognition motif-containing protein
MSTNTLKKEEMKQKNKIHIKNIPQGHSTEEMEKNLSRLFSSFGKIIDVKVLQNKYNKWYGFITFNDDHFVEKILSMKINFEGKNLKITRAKKPQLNLKNDSYLEKSKKIFIGGLPTKVKRKELLDYFSVFGKINDLCLPLKDNREKTNKGYGFITFEDSNAVEKVVNSQENHYLRGKMIEIKIAKPRHHLSPNFKAYCAKKSQSKSFSKNIFLPSDNIKKNQENLSYVNIKCDDEFFKLNPNLIQYQNQLSIKFQLKTCPDCNKVIFSKKNFFLFRHK